MSFDRNGHITTLYVTTAISTSSLDTQTKIEKIKLCIEAVKEVLSEIDKYEERRAPDAVT